MLTRYASTYPEILDLVRRELSKQLGIEVSPDRISFLGNYLHILSVLTEDILFYVQMLSNESFLSRALLTSSILEHAKSLGYLPKAVVPARGSLTLYINLTHFDRLSLRPTTLRFVGKDHLVVYTSDGQLSLTLNIGRGIRSASLTTDIGTQECTSFFTTVTTPQKTFPAWSIIVPVKQAITHTITYVLSETDVEGTKVPTIEIPLHNYFSSEEVERYQIGDVRVSVDGIAYTPYDSLFSIPRGATGCVLSVETTRVLVYLGNGIFGKKEKAGSVVTISISASLGSKGDVPANELTLAEPLRDNYTGSVLDVYVSHSSIGGGQDGETPNEVRNNTIRSLRSRDRLVTVSDFLDVTRLVAVPWLDVLPIVKQADISVNDTKLYIVPTLGNTPCLVNSISKSWSPIPSPNTILVPQESTLVDTNGNQWISPFEIVLVSPITDYYSVEYRYTSNLQILTPVIRSQTLHSQDNITSAKVDTMQWSFTPSTSTLTDQLSLSVTSSSPLDTSNFLTHFKVISIVRNTLTLEEIVTNTWTVESVTPQQGKYLVVLKTTHSSDIFNTNTYTQTIDISATVNSIEETVYRGYVTSFRLKQNLSECFTTSVEQSGNTITLYEVPVVEKSYFNANKNEIYTQIIPTLLSYLDQIQSRRMLTNKVSLAFAKTVGPIVNPLYNSSGSKVYYTGCTNVGTLPLVLDVDVVVESGVDPDEVVNQIREKLTTWTNEARGIHRNYTPEEVYALLRDIPHVLKLRVNSPSTPIIYDFSLSTLQPQDVKTLVPEYIWFDPQAIKITLVDQIEVQC